MAKQKHNDDADRSGDAAGLFVWGLLTGALVGVSLALAFAPASGEQTRDYLRSKSREIGEEAIESASDASDRARAMAEDLGAGASDLYERGRRIVAQARETVKGAVDEGAATVAEERTRLESEAPTAPASSETPDPSQHEPQ